ncbi:hypothetical protein T4D_16085 [Trichinella pseudospiralis]|uniref:Uncharacterized protein n=1 Tax=Trichinella pseudospiralis TaxID=6337 RepID=A0A0V1FP03_TRIPS|nr:hypothetical protein T4D_16085 [Trichinella pseudospiralis]
MTIEILHDLEFFLVLLLYLVDVFIFWDLSKAVIDGPTNGRADWFRRGFPEHRVGEAWTLFQAPLLTVFPGSIRPMQTNRHKSADVVGHKFSWKFHARSSYHKIVFTCVVAVGGTASISSGWEAPFGSSGGFKCSPASLAIHHHLAKQKPPVYHKLPFTAACIEFQICNSRP